MNDMRQGSSHFISSLGRKWVCFPLSEMKVHSETVVGWGFIKKLHFSEELGDMKQ